MKYSLLVLLLACSLNTFSQKSVFFPEAKFQTGDQQAWKELNFDDSKWKSIKTTERWEQQGYDGYDGYAWYRIKFILPSSLKKNAFWKDSLSFLMSKIDDADETFLNGVKIGKTGLLPTDAGGPVGQWDVNRVYNIAADSKSIYWDKENVIAIRVLDLSGGGGMFGNSPSVKMLEPQDVLDLKLVQDNIIFNKYITSVANTSRKTIEGAWTITVKNGEENKIVKTIVKPVTLAAFGSLIDSVSVTMNKGLQIFSSFKEKHTGNIKSVIKITPYILTPAPSPFPRINSASVFGVRPGSPVLFKVASTGKRPLQYKAINLPEGLAINEKTGIITGIMQAKGDYKVQLIVSNVVGKATQNFIIKAGDKLALTPPMGWNSWNCWGLTVSDEKVKSSAQSFIDKGLIDHGWTYINIDDGWENATRDTEGNIIPNEKFSDMSSLGHWLHNNGLKFGIYSSPGTKTCGGYLGSYQHELQDATTYAKWGVDYLKYDWCSYEDVFVKQHDSSLSAYQKPYKVMQSALQAQPHDIVYSLCQYGMKDVWKWGADVNGNSWRTTGDIQDTWESVQSIGFSQSKLYPFAQPGHWNDPDMLVVGQVGWSGQLRPTRLTPDEQYAHISLWCLLSAPLLIGCDVSKLDDFTLNLLTNDEVLAIDQDALGKQAQQKVKTNNYEILVKEVVDGKKAIGIFNLSDDYQNIQLNFSDIGLQGNFTVRDLWRQKNIGVAQKYNSKVPPHGVTLILLSK